MRTNQKALATEVLVHAALTCSPSAADWTDKTDGSQKTVPTKHRKDAKEIKLVPKIKLSGLFRARRTVAERRRVFRRQKTCYRDGAQAAE